MDRDETQWAQMMADARAENGDGVDMRGGKKYTKVAVRVEILRRALGPDAGITTEIVRYATEAGEPIVVKATLRVGSEIVSTGHAEEIRGKGNVNQTSALENAETSAIGRALAAAGVHGGEFASANEMDGVTRKAEAKDEADKAKKEARAKAIKDKLAAMETCDTLDELKAFWAGLEPWLRDVEAVSHAKDSRKTALSTDPATLMAGG